jgi:hypothetical protein
MRRGPTLVEIEEDRMKRTAAVMLLASLMVALAGGPAAAAPSHPGATRQNADGLCYIEGGWGGLFYCSTDKRWKKPDKFYQVFVIGMDQSVWTKWANAQNTYAWLDMGGTCIPYQQIKLETLPGRWAMTVNCKGAYDNAWWHLRRFDDGRWTGWIKGYANP